MCFIWSRYEDIGRRKMKLVKEIWRWRRLSILSIYGRALISRSKEMHKARFIRWGFHVLCLKLDLIVVIFIIGSVTLELHTKGYAML